MAVKKIGNALNYTTSLGGKANPQTTRFLRFTSVGSFTFSLDLLILYFLTDILGFFYLFSAGIAFFTANTMNYAINREWSFKATKQKPFKGYIYFLFVDIGTAILMLALLATFVEKLGINYLIARITVGLFVGTLNYIINSKVSFGISAFKK